MPSDQFEIQTIVKKDGNNDEYYVALPDLPATVCLSEVVFLIFHPREGETRGTLVIKPREPRTEARRPTPPVSKGAVTAVQENVENVFFSEVQRCEDRFAGSGYVGLGYFLTNWKSSRLPFGVEARKPILERLIETKRVIQYQAADGKDAIKTAR